MKRNSKLGDWLMDTALFVTTVLLIQAPIEAAALTPATILAALAVAAACLAAGLWLQEDDDAKPAKGRQPDRKKNDGRRRKYARRTSLRTGARKARRKKRRRPS